MRVVEHDDLPDRLEPSAQLLAATTGWRPVDFARLREAKRLGYPASSYSAVYAVEGDEVQSVVKVLRIPYTMADGDVETVSGVAGVVTRPESSRRGLARRLLERVHAKEAAAGNRFVFLWTGKTNKAHNLYESMGYVDVHTPGRAMFRCVKPRKYPAGYEVRRAKRGDAKSILNLHTEATAGRVGFTPRPKGLLPALFKLGFAKPGDFRLILFRGDPVGYFHLEQGASWADSMEVVLKNRDDAAVALALLEAQASRGWLMLTGTFVRDQRALLARRGYALAGTSYASLLARPLKDGSGPRLDELGTAESSFTCQALDMF